ncbi:MAG: hypothetical protein JSS62_04675 [Verrucomicrobia bacterium]|nr:hypothetical protein [Verrucomicrobiota bacterium]MBS0645737.1 hypothetical protein [Verrucomicrobiota bacterium]
MTSVATEATRSTQHVVLHMVNEGISRSNIATTQQSSLCGRVCEQWRLNLFILGIALTVSTLVVYFLTKDPQYLYIAIGAGTISLSFILYVTYRYPFANDMHQTSQALHQQVAEQRRLVSEQTENLNTQKSLTASQQQDLDHLNQSLCQQQDLNREQKENLIQLEAQLRQAKDIVAQQLTNLKQLESTIAAAEQLNHEQESNLTRLRQDLEDQSQQIKTMLEVNKELSDKLKRLEILTEKTQQTKLQLLTTKNSLADDEKQLRLVQAAFSKELETLVQERTKLQREEHALKDDIERLSQERMQLEKEQQVFLKDLQRKKHGKRFVPSSTNA